MRLDEILGTDSDILERVLNSAGATGFLQRLESADDWSAIILTWALIEASLTEAICIKLVEENIRGVIRALPLNGKGGKTRMAEELGVISKNEAKFISEFSFFRNSFAHGLKWFGSSIQSFVAQVANIDQYEKALIFAEHRSESGETIDFKSSPRTIILGNALFVCRNAVGMASFDEESRYGDYEDYYD